MLGGYAQQPTVQQAHTQLFHRCVPHVNTKLTLDSTPADWKLVSVQTQVVAGTNYKYKAQHSGKMYSVTIFQPLPHTGADPEVSQAVAL